MEYLPSAHQAEGHPKTAAKVVKRSIILFGAGAAVIALNVKSVYTLWYLASDLVYCILFPQLTMALFYKEQIFTGRLLDLQLQSF